MNFLSSSIENIQTKPIQRCIELQRLRLRLIVDLQFTTYSTKGYVRSANMKLKKLFLDAHKKRLASINFNIFFYYEFIHLLYERSDDGDD